MISTLYAGMDGETRLLVERQVVFGVWSLVVWG